MLILPSRAALWHAQGVSEVFQGHATVQLQGSTAKGTGLEGYSDWDFFVRTDGTIAQVTHMQRMAVVRAVERHMAAACIHYEMQCGQNRIWLRRGEDKDGPLPEVDVVFDKFKEDVRVAPNPKALASSHAAQQVGIFLGS